MAARTASKVSPGDDAKDVEADDTKAAPLHDQETKNRTPAKAPDEDTIRATLHRLATREPHSFHQTTIYYGLVRQDTPPRRKYGLLTISIGIVFLQCFVASGFAIGVNFSTCSENSDCHRGNFCDKGLCEWCESEWEHCCETNSTKECFWDEKGSQNMCTTCTTDKGFETHADAVRDRVDSMMIQDWLTLGLASMVVAFAVFAEIRDAMLVEIALRDVSERREVSRGWRFAIRGLNFARYYIMLPNVILSVVALVLNDGGRVKDVCLNTVAVLFLLDIDDLAFRHGLDERTRKEAEESARVRVTDADERILNAIKLVCVLAIPGTVFVGISGTYVAQGFPESLGIIFAPVLPIVVRFLQRVKEGRGACGGIGWGMAGFFAYLIWYLLMYNLIYFVGNGSNTFEDD